jgi:hypothetical protein
MSLKRYDGVMIIDHRANGHPIPGLPEKAGTFVELRTVSCRHCGGVWRENPWRLRPREYCKTCNKYICDGCAAVSKQPGYVHRTIDDLTEMVQSGRYAIAGGTVCDPKLIRIGAK